MSELTTGHALLLQAALIIVTILMLDWRESSFGPAMPGGANDRPGERNDEGDPRIGSVSEPEHRNPEGREP